MKEATLLGSAEYCEWAHSVKETISQHLSEKDAKDWHVQFAEKMETVKNFEAFYHNFMVSVLEIALPHDKHGVIQPVIDLHKNYKNATKKEWLRAEARADGAAAAARALCGLVKPRVAVKADWATEAARISAAVLGKPRAADWPVAAIWAVQLVALADKRSTFNQAEAWQKIRDAFLNADGGK